MTPSAPAQRRSSALRCFSASGCDGGRDVVNHRPDVEGFQKELHPAGLDFREVEDAVDQRQQMLAGRVNFLEFGNGAVESQVSGLLFQHLAVADDRVQGCSQLVAHVRQELTLGAVGRLGDPRFEQFFLRAQVRGDAAEARRDGGEDRQQQDAERPGLDESQIAKLVRENVTFDSLDNVVELRVGNLGHRPFRLEPLQIAGRQMQDHSVPGRDVGFVHVREWREEGIVRIGPDDPPRLEETEPSLPDAFRRFVAHVALGDQLPLERVEHRGIAAESDQLTREGAVTLDAVVRNQECGREGGKDQDGARHHQEAWSCSPFVACRVHDAPLASEAGSRRHPAAPR